MKNLFLTPATVALVLAASSAQSQVYVDCGRFQSSQDRQWCYAQQAQIYQDYSNSWNGIGDQWQGVHDWGGDFIRNVGRATGQGWIGTYGGAAWDAPGYVNDAYNWYQGW